MNKLRKTMIKVLPKVLPVILIFGLFILESQTSFASTGIVSGVTKSANSIRDLLIKIANSILGVAALISLIIYAATKDPNSKGHAQKWFIGVVVGLIITNLFVPIQTFINSLGK